MVHNRVPGMEIAVEVLEGFAEEIVLLESVQ
jgi:hypothetical protein